MANPPNELESLLSRVRAGDNDAVREIVETYEPAIWKKARRRLGQLRALFDATDVLQEVWMDFFSKRVHQRTFQLEAELIRYLAGMAHKVILKLRRRYLDTRKRDLRRRVPLDSSAVSANRDLVDRRRGPEEKVVAEERWERLLKRMAPRGRRVLEMLRGGCDQQEVAEVLGVNERIVRRIVERAGQRALSRAS